MKRIFYTISAAALLIGLAGCSMEERMGSEAIQKQYQGKITNPEEIRNYLKSLQTDPGLMTGEFRTEEGATMRSEVPVGDVVVEKEPGVYEGVPGYWVTTKRRYRVSQLFDETIILDPTADILYPGCVIRGGSIEDGTYAAISDVEVGDVTFSISKVLAQGQDASAVSHTVHNIRMSDYRKVFSEWSQLFFKPGAVTSMHSLESVTSQEEAAMKIGASFKHEAVTIAANLGFDFSKDSNHILAKFVQKQYTVTTDIPKTPTIFASVDTEVINKYQPVYISNITYGRMIFMSVDTKHTLAEVQMALNCAVKAIDLNIDLDAKYKKVLEDSKINVTIIGGSAASQNFALTDGWVGFRQFMTTANEMHELTPISFALRYAADNSIARIVSQSEYEVVNKTFVREFNEVSLDVCLDGLRGTESRSLIETGRQFEMYGAGWMTFNGEKKELFNIGRRSYVNVQKGIEFTHVDGTRSEMKISKPANMSFEDFMHSRVRIYTHMRDYDARIIAKNDKDYGEAYQEFSVEDLVAISRSENPYFVVTSHGNGVKVETKMKINKVYYK